MCMPVIGHFLPSILGAGGSGVENIQDIGVIAAAVFDDDAGGVGDARFEAANVADEVKTLGFGINAVPKCADIDVLSQLPDGDVSDVKVMIAGLGLGRSRTLGPQPALNLFPAQDFAVDQWRIVAGVGEQVDAKRRVRDHDVLLRSRIDCRRLVGGLDAYLDGITYREFRIVRGELKNVVSARRKDGRGFGARRRRKLGRFRGRLAGSSR